MAQKFVQNRKCGTLSEFYKLTMISIKNVHDLIISSFKYNG